MKPIHEQLQELKETTSFLNDSMLMMIQSDDEQSDSTMLGLIHSLRALEIRFDELISQTDKTDKNGREGGKLVPVK
ncbi:hypothetical protein N9L48_01880 [Psychrosphaera sp.]|nr:hypothetical protein [Psychrosphaera sp.]